MITAVFVHADKRVELVPVRSEVHVYRIPLRPQFSVIDGLDAAETINIQTIDYALACRRMFNGRPVYAAPGIRVLEAMAVAIVRNRRQDIAAADNQCRNDVLELFREHRYRITLDSFVGRMPWGVHERKESEAQCLVKRGARRLCAISERPW